MRRDEFRIWLEEHGAVVEDGIVQHFGDAAGEYASIFEGALAIADRSERETVVATGTEVVELVQGLVTNDVFELAKVGSGQLNTAVNIKGRFVADMRILHVPELLVFDFERGRVEADVIAHFKRNIINEDAQFADRSEQTARILLVGAGSADLLMSTTRGLGRPFALVDDWGATWGQIEEADVIIQKIPTYGLEAYELYVDRDAQHRVWQALASEKDLVPVGEEALETLRIDAGQPRFGVELDEKVIPLEADMNHAVAYNKGCYLGQEIIARLDTLGTPARMLRRLILQGDEVPEPGSEIRVKDKKVGEVRSSIFSLSAKAPVALAYIKRKFNEPGATVSVDIHGEPVEATIYALHEDATTELQSVG